MKSPIVLILSLLFLSLYSGPLLAYLHTETLMSGKVVKFDKFFVWAQPKYGGVHKISKEDLIPSNERVFEGRNISWRADIEFKAKSDWESLDVAHIKAFKDFQIEKLHAGIMKLLKVKRSFIYENQNEPVKVSKNKLEKLTDLFVDSAHSKVSKADQITKKIEQSWASKCKGDGCCAPLGFPSKRSRRNGSCRMAWNSCNDKFIKSSKVCYSRNRFCGRRNVVRCSEFICRPSSREKGKRNQEKIFINRERSRFYRIDWRSTNRKKDYRGKSKARYRGLCIQVPNETKHRNLTGLCLKACYGSQVPEQLRRERMEEVKSMIREEPKKFINWYSGVTQGCKSTNRGLEKNEKQYFRHCKNLMTIVRALKAEVKNDPVYLANLTDKERNYFTCFPMGKAEKCNNPKEDFNGKRRKIKKGVYSLLVNCENSRTGETRFGFMFVVGKKALANLKANNLANRGSFYTKSLPTLGHVKCKSMPQSESPNNRCIGFQHISKNRLSGYGKSCAQCTYGKGICLGGRIGNELVYENVVARCKCYGNMRGHSLSSENLEKCSGKSSDVIAIKGVRSEKDRRRYQRKLKTNTRKI